MPFQKNNKYGAKPQSEKALDPKPLCIKLDSETRQQLVSIPDWQNKLRNVLPKLIIEWSQSSDGG